VPGRKVVAWDAQDTTIAAATDAVSADLAAAMDPRDRRDKMAHQAAEGRPDQRE